MNLEETISDDEKISSALQRLKAYSLPVTRELPTIRYDELGVISACISGSTGNPSSIDVAEVAQTLGLDRKSVQNALDRIAELSLVRKSAQGEYISDLQTRLNLKKRAMFVLSPDTQNFLLNRAPEVLDYILAYASLFPYIPQTSVPLPPPSPFAKGSPKSR